MNLILFDDDQRDHLLPFTFTRPVADIRIGILTIREKWETIFSSNASTITRHYLQKKFPLSGLKDCLLINGALLPDEKMIAFAKQLKRGQQVVWQNRLLLAHFERLPDIGTEGLKPFKDVETINNESLPLLISNTWDIFSLNDKAIHADFALLTSGKKSASITTTNQVVGAENIFVEAGAKVSCSILNAANGPIYIGKNAEVMEGCMIRGPFSLGENTVLKMGAKMYGGTTIGPGCKVGGEVTNSVIFGNSNKAHDGFLGNSVIGEWCNLGADTNNSNLKNNYGMVKVYNYAMAGYTDTGLQFCGLMMGDHSKSGINTMFNTGTVTGVCANIFGSGFPPKFIPSFYWGGAEEAETFLLDKAIELAKRVYERRGKLFDKTEEDILSHLFMSNLKPPAEND